jgi:chromosome segregation ATPase
MPKRKIRDIEEDEFIGIIEGTVTRVIQPLRKDMDIIKSDVSELKSDVAVLKSDVAVLKSDVAVLKADMREVKGDIRDIKERLTNLERLNVSFYHYLRTITQSLAKWLDKGEPERRELAASLMGILKEMESISYPPDAVAIQSIKKGLINFFDSFGELKQQGLLNTEELLPVLEELDDHLKQAIELLKTS